jgi:hypothetical protein
VKDLEHLEGRIERKVRRRKEEGISAKVGVNVYSQ